MLCATGRRPRQCGQSCPIIDLGRSVPACANAAVPYCTPADRPAGLADRCSGDAHAANSGPTYAAAVCHLCGHALWLMKWRERHCLCRGRKSQSETGNSYYAAPSIEVLSVALLTWRRFRAGGCPDKLREEAAGGQSQHHRDKYHIPPFNRTDKALP